MCKFLRDRRLLCDPDWESLCSAPSDSLHFCS